MKWFYLALLPFLFQLFACPVGFAVGEGSWLPEPSRLHLRLGSDYLSTNGNFDTNGNRQSLLLSGDFIKITEFKFYVEPEYAIADNLAARVRLGFITNSGTSDTGLTTGTLLSGSGLGDIILGLKYRVRVVRPALVLELATTLPTYGRSVNTSQDLLIGDGSIDATLALHANYTSRRLYLITSPYFQFRTGGYAPRIGADLGIGIKFPPILFMPFVEGSLSLGDNLLFDRSEFVHSPQGSGNSYLRLSGSPTTMNIGAKIGAQISPSYFLETYFRASVIGIRSAAFWQIGANIMIRMDFSEPDNRTQVQEIPFDAKPEDVVPPPE